MQNTRQLVKNMATQTFSFAISMIISFFLTKFIVEKIGAEVYGFVGLSNNITSYVTVFTAAINSLANRYITIAYVKGDTESANKYFSSVTAANIFVVVLITVPAVLMLVWLEKMIHIPASHIADVKALWAFVFAMFAIQLVFGRMEVATFAKNRLDLSAMRNMESNVIKLVLLLALYMFFSPKVFYVGISAFVCSLYVIAANARYMRKLTPELKFSRALVDGSAVKEMMGVGIWNSANQMSQMLFTGLDLLIANLFIGAAGMGLLSISKTLPVHIITFIGMIAGVFYPAMTISYAKDDKGEFIHETNFAVRVSGLICSVPVIGIMMFGEPFYRLWLPSLSAGEIREVSILAILTLIPQYFSMYLFPLYQVNTLTCKLKVPSIVNVALGVVNVVLVFALLKFTNLGLYAIAGVSSVLLTLRILIFVPMYAAYSLKKNIFTFYPPLIRGMILNVILTVLFGVTAKFIQPGNIISFILWVGVSAITGYIIGVLVMFKKEDFKKFSQMLKKR